MTDKVFYMPFDVNGPQALFAQMEYGNMQGSMKKNQIEIDREIEKGNMAVEVWYDGKKAPFLAGLSEGQVYIRGHGMPGFRSIEGGRGGERVDYHTVVDRIIASGLRKILIGEDALEIDRLWQKMYRSTMYCGRHSTTITAMAAIDMALWDLKGKKFGQPIHRLLGGKRHDRFRAYASILFGKDGRQTADIGRRWIDAGYTAVKFGWEPMGQNEALDRELVAGARKGLGIRPSC